MCFSAPPLSVASSRFFLSLSARGFSRCQEPPWPHTSYSLSVPQPGPRPASAGWERMGRARTGPVGSSTLVQGHSWQRVVTGLSGSSPSPISVLSFSSEHASLVLLCRALVHTAGRKASDCLRPMPACPWGGAVCLAAGLPPSLVPAKKEQITPLCHVTS